MDDVPQLGTAQDDLRREKSRTDTPARQKQAAEARKRIVHEGKSVTSGAVTGKLDKHSGVPVVVSNTSVVVFLSLTRILSYRTRSPKNSCRSTLTFIR